MIRLVMAAQIALTGSGSVPAEPVGPAVSSEQSIPALSSFPWISSRSRQSATVYYHCRRRGVGGLFPADGEAELEAVRNEVRLMIYTQKARCRSERARLLASLDADLRRNNDRNPNRSAPAGYAEWVLDVYERDVNDRIFAGFALF